MRYVVDFGTANAGATPVFTTFDRLDTLAAMTPPTITSMGDGQFYFDIDWSLTTATSIAFKVTAAGIELSDVISSPDVVLPGATTASAGVSSLVGYSQVGPLVARAGTQLGVLNINPASQASYDPFGSTNPLVVQLLEFLNDVGSELASKVKRHLVRDCAFTTAGGATSYALPADFVEMVDGAAWDLTSTDPLDGPVSEARAAYLRAWSSGPLATTPFQIRGNRLVFPVYPGDGVDVRLPYYSEYWVQTAASGTGPDADHATANTDYVLFDPTLVVRGLKLKYLQAKGRDTSIAYAEFSDRLEYVKGKIGGGAVVTLAGGSPNDEWIDGSANLPQVLG